VRVGKDWANEIAREYLVDMGRLIALVNQKNRTDAGPNLHLLSFPLVGITSSPGLFSLLRKPLWPRTAR
jgi:hypothetical protein